MVKSREIALSKASLTEVSLEVFSVDTFHCIQLKPGERNERTHCCLYANGVLAS